MAVVSISRIQVRRGQKNAGSGLPQLASGEFGWAVDSQELYIGNGSVAEGAPYVGNTKLLSETDNLFEFANTYQYKSGTNVQTGDSANNPVLRTLQARLDDRISIRAFGAAGDGTNQTVAIQRAVDQLYLNSSNKGTTGARVELIFEAGEYTITDTIKLPPYTTIRGAGINKTIINAGNHTAFQTINETSTPGIYADDADSTTLNQARNLSVSDLTINTTQGPALELISCKDSMFKNILLSGGYSLGDLVVSTSVGIKITSLSTAVSSNNNTFDNVQIKNFATAVYSDNDIKDNIWNECTFDTLYQGLAFGVGTIPGNSGMETGPINNTITNSTFNEIYTSAIKVFTGKNNISSNNKFYQVGNQGGTSQFNQHPVIAFVGPLDVESPGTELAVVSVNSSVGDWFQRSQELGYNEVYKNNVAYYPEVEGPAITDLATTHKLTIGQQDWSKLFKLPADTAKGYEIEYVYKSTQVAASRIGTMTLVIDPENDTFTFSDDYNYTGNSIYAENLRFNAQNYDEDADNSVDSVAIMMLNLTSSDTATMHYKVKTKS
jgi:hypothetical protein